MNADRAAGCRSSPASRPCARSGAGARTTDTRCSRPATSCRPSLKGGTWMVTYPASCDLTCDITYLPAHVDAEGDGQGGRGRGDRPPLTAAVADDPWFAEHPLRFTWSDDVVPAEMPADHPLVATALDVLRRPSAGPASPPALDSWHDAATFTRPPARRRSASGPTASTAPTQSTSACRSTASPTSPPPSPSRRCAGAGWRDGQKSAVSGARAKEDAVIIHMSIHTPKPGKEGELIASMRRFGAAGSSPAWLRRRARAA